MLNDYFSLGLSGTELEHYAGQLGSDCPFFIRNTVAYVTGRGELIHPLDLDFTGQYILLYHPGIHISTADAYRRMQPDDSRPSLKELVSAPPDSWKKHLKNDFEEYVLASYPEMAQLKNHLYDAGAYYAALSGSGSALFGLFRQMPVDKYLLRPEFLACTRL